MKLFVRVRQDYLDLLWMRKKNHFEYHRILTRESSEAQLAAKVRSVGIESKKTETILVLQRGEVLQKELILDKTACRDITGEAEAAIRQTLPCSPDEMAYGVALETAGESARGLLVSVPQNHLNKIIAFLTQTGIHPDEIVTEDQTLSWYGRAFYPDRYVLLIERSPGGMLCVLNHNGQMKLSRKCESFQDLSMAMIEAGVRPERIGLAGNWNAAEVLELESRFSAPVEKWPARPVVPEADASFFGASYYPAYPYLSLLSNTEKMKKRKHRLISRTRSAGIAVLVFWILLGGAAWSHWMQRQAQSKALDRELVSVIRETRGAVSLEKKLNLLQDIQQKRFEQMQILKELSLQMPSSVTLIRFEITDGGFRFVGEGPAHSVMTRTLDIFEGLSSVESAKLERTRLRKRLNREYFEFEVTGKWKQ